MDNLRKVQSMNFDDIYLSHTLSLDPKSIVVNAKKKIIDYITYREERETYLLDKLRVCLKIRINTCFRRITG
jgi:hypothetical protein